MKKMLCEFDDDLYEMIPRPRRTWVQNMVYNQIMLDKTRVESGMESKIVAISPKKANPDKIR